MLTDMWMGKHKYIGFVLISWYVYQNKSSYYLLNTYYTKRCSKHFM